MLLYNSSRGVGSLSQGFQAKKSGIRQVGFVPPALPLYRGRDIASFAVVSCCFTSARCANLLRSLCHPQTHPCSVVQVFSSSESWHHATSLYSRQKGLTWLCVSVKPCQSSRTRTCLRPFLCSKGTSKLGMSGRHSLSSCMQHV